MSIYRRAAKSDSVRAEIVKALNAAGVRTWDIRVPCDLLCLVHGRWQTLELKTPRGKRGKPRKRNDQKAQDEFLASTPTPVCTNAIEALTALGLSDIAVATPLNISRDFSSPHPGVAASLAAAPSNRRSIA